MQLKQRLARLFRTLSLKGPPRHCQHHHGEHGNDANRHMNRRSFEELVASFENKDRDLWQQPLRVLALIGDLNGKTVMEIGSGTGYFSFRLAAAGARVICADTDERFLEYIRERLQRQDIAGGQITLRKLKPESPSLQTAEVDVVLIVNTYHHIEKRVDYFNRVLQGLKPGGKLIVVDFQKRDLPVGPPTGIKLSEDEVIAELVRAGFSRFSLDRVSLPYQYLIEAS